MRSQSDPAPSNIRWPFSPPDNKRSLDHDGAEKAAPSNIDWPFSLPDNKKSLDHDGAE
jgi:hypothetical protein